MLLSIIIIKRRRRNCCGVRGIKYFRKSFSRKIVHIRLSGLVSYHPSEDYFPVISYTIVFYFILNV